MSEFKVNTITNRDGSYGPQVCGITTFGSSGMTLPSGPTEMRGGRGRGIFAGQNQPTSDTIDFIEIGTTGNSADFGDLSRSKQATSATASSTRGVVFGGYSSPNYYTDIDYITISSGGGGNEFGDLVHDRGWSAAASDGNRGVVAGTWPGPTAIEFVNIATTGDSNIFGDLSVSAVGNIAGGNQEITGGCESHTRGIFGGGAHGNPSTTAVNLIQYITIQTLGNSIKFGELTRLAYGVTACSSDTRGIFMGGRTPSVQDVIDYITIATEGNAIDFGNLLANNRDMSAVSNITRGVGAGGLAPSDAINVMQFVTIATTGNAVDFGDLSSARAQMGGCSDLHGGLVR